MTAGGAAYGGGGKKSSHAKAHGPITMRLLGDYPCLDPYGQNCGGLISQEVFNSLYDHLVYIAPGPKNSVKLVPYLAQSWKATPTQITFTLKKGVTCADGTKVNAHVAAISINSYFVRAAAEGTNLKGTWGAGPYHATYKGARTVVFTLGTPNPWAIYRFAQAIPIVCPKGISPNNSPTPLTIFNTASQGSGPYTMVSATHGSQVVVKLRKDWKWGPDGATAADLPSQITMKEVTDETTAANLISTGGLDISQISGNNIPRLLADKNLKHFTALSFSSYIIDFNELPGHVTTDKAVRKAIAMVIDRNAFGKAAFGGSFFAVSTNFISPQTKCYENLSSSLASKKPNLAGAQAVLKADGYTMGSDGFFQKGGKTLTLDLDSTTAGINQAGDYVVAVLTQLGIKVNATIGDYNTFLQKAIAGSFDISTDTYPALLPTPNYFAYDLIGTGNFDKTVDPQAEKYYNAAATELGCNNWKPFFKTEVANYDFIPTVYPVTYWFTRNNIKLFPQPNLIEQQYIRQP